MEHALDIKECIGPDSAAAAHLLGAGQAQRAAHACGTVVELAVGCKAAVHVSDRLGNIAAEVHSDLQRGRASCLCGRVRAARCAVGGSSLAHQGRRAQRRGSYSPHTRRRGPRRLPPHGLCCLPAGARQSGDVSLGHQSHLVRCGLNSVQRPAPVNTTAKAFSLMARALQEVRQPGMQVTLQAQCGGPEATMALSAADLGVCCTIARHSSHNPQAHLRGGRNRKAQQRHQGQARRHFSQHLC